MWNPQDYGYFLLIYKTITENNKHHEIHANKVASNHLLHKYCDSQITFTVSPIVDN